MYVLRQPVAYQTLQEDSSDSDAGLLQEGQRWGGGAKEADQAGAPDTGVTWHRCIQGINPLAR